MKESGMWIGWYGLLVGIPLLITAMLMKDWIMTFTHKTSGLVSRMRRKGA